MDENWAVPLSQEAPMWIFVRSQQQGIILRKTGGPDPGLASTRSRSLTFDPWTQRLAGEKYISHKLWEFFGRFMG